MSASSEETPAEQDEHVIGARLQLMLPAFRSAFSPVHVEPNLGSGRIYGGKSEVWSRSLACREQDTTTASGVEANHIISEPGQRSQTRKLRESQA